MCYNVKLRVKSSVFKWRLKLSVTTATWLDGRLFQTRDAAAVKEQWPMVERRVERTTSQFVIADCRCRLKSTSALCEEDSRLDTAVPGHADRRRWEPRVCNQCCSRVCSCAATVQSPPPSVTVRSLRSSTLLQYSTVRQAQLCEISLGLKHRPQSERWITQKSRVHSEVLVNYFGSAAFGIMSEKVKNYFSAFWGEFRSWSEHGIRTQRGWSDEFFYVE